MRRLERDVDFAEFLKALRRSGRPRYLPFYEHVAREEFIERRLGRPLPDAQRYPTAYMPVENYLIILEEGIKATG